MSIECPLPDYSNIPEQAFKIVKETSTIALVGASPKPERPSYQVMKYLLEQGFKVIPVNPGQKEILGEKCYSSLLDIPKDILIDTVIIFRNPDYVLEIIEEALQRKIKYFWMQERIINEESFKKAVEKGMQGVMNMCFKKVHLVSKNKA